MKIPSSKHGLIVFVINKGKKTSYFHTAFVMRNCLFVWLSMRLSFHEKAKIDLGLPLIKSLVTMPKTR